MEKYMKISMILHKLYNLLKKGFCQKTYARTKNGKSCEIYDKKAVNFCIIGGWKKLGFAHGYLLPNVLLNLMVNTDIAKFNDTHTKSTVLKTIQKAKNLAIQNERKNIHA